MKQLTGFRNLLHCYALPNSGCLLLLIVLCCYCIVVTVLMIHGRLSPIKSIYDRRIKPISKSNYSSHSESNKTYIGLPKEIDAINATILKENSKNVKGMSKSNVKTDRSKPNNEKLQASQQLIKKTPKTSKKKQSLSVIDVYQRIKTDWAFNATAAEELRHLLENECKSSEMCVTSQHSLKINDSLNYTAEESSILMTSSIMNRLPKESPYKWNMFKKCSIVGSSGILLGSQCGKEIDSADFVVRFNWAKTLNFTDDVGSKTSLVTCNPVIIRQQYSRLAENMTEKFRQDILTEYGNTALYIQAFYHLHCTETAFRTQDVLESTQIKVVFPHPSHMLSVRKFWQDHGILSNRLSSGLLLMTSFLSFCQEVHLFGFWPFQEDKHGTPLPFYYYDPTHKPRESRVEGNVHNMPSEFNLFKDLNNKGIIRLHVDKC